MTSIHLLLAFISIGPLMVFTFLMLIWTGARLPFFAAAGLAVLAGHLAGLEVSWWLCRIIGYPPLSLFFGPCPSCDGRPAGWWFQWRSHSLLVLGCGDCGQKVELWLSRTRYAEPPSALPRYELRWPEFLGRWRRIADKAA